MKKALCFLLSLTACLAIFCVEASATEAKKSAYTVSETATGYSLSQSGETLRVEASLSNILLDIPPSSTVIFDSVTADTPPVFGEGEYTLLGSLSLLADYHFSVNEGTSLYFDGFGLELLGRGSLRIKGGSVRMENSTVCSGDCSALILDYLPSSDFTLVSGNVHSASENSAIRSELGRVNILGGSVVNTGGVAIYNGTSLILSGSPIVSGVGSDVLTDRAISLSDGKTKYDPKTVLRVSFAKAFAEGTLTEVFYSSSRDSTENVRLTDPSGREYGITYFDSSLHSEERCFSAVYLPYTVTYYGRNGAFRTEEKLRGEYVGRPTAPEIYGYIHTGWYLDREFSVGFSFDTPITSDISLYADYRLLPPSFKANSYTAEYDGGEHTLSVESLSHPLSDEGFFGFRWYKDGEFVSDSESLTLTDCADSGIYSASITFYHAADSVTVTAENIAFLITKKGLSVPHPAPKYYSGEPFSPQIEISPYYTVSSLSATDVGIYSVEITLADPANYAFVGSAEPTVTVGFEILRAENYWITSPSVKDIYEGGVPFPMACPRFGSVRFLFSDSADGEYSEAPPEGVGTKYMKAIVVGTDNYTALEGEPIAFSVHTEEVLSLSLADSPEKLEYTAFEHFSGEGMSILVSYSGGRSEYIGIDSVEVSYQQGEAFLYGDNAVNLFYKGKSLRVPVTVLRAEYDLSGLAFEDFDVVYDGKYHGISYPENAVLGADGYPLVIRAEGGGIDAGVYNISVVFYTQSNNYVVPHERSVTLTVTPRYASVIFGELEFVYDGTLKCPTAEFIDVFGVKRALSVIGGATDAGDCYTAVAESYSANYILSEPSCTFVIKKRDFDLSDVRWNASSFVYDGEEKCVFVTNLPDGLFAVGYTDGSATSAGSYTATVSFSYDEKNYNPPKSLSYVWTIHKAEYDISGIEFLDAEATYDGLPHIPTLLGDMPVGKDGIALNYRMEGFATGVADGKSEVLLVFESASPNYRAPKPLSAYITVLPKGIFVEWSVAQYTYDGTEHLPSAYSGECEISVSGGGVNAGTHTAYASSTSPNFEVLNATVTFTVTKANNAWQTLPSIGDFYTSKSPVPSAAADYGEVIYRYYTDSECTEEISFPFTEGSYYMLALVEEGDDYFGITHQPIEFSVLRVELVSIDFTLYRNELKAFSSVTDGDFSAVAHFNDGTSLPLTLGDLSVSYTSGFAPCRGDTEVKFSYLDKTLTFPISVDYADYDMSGVSWEDRVTVYDGTPKLPSIVGLPDGITLLGYDSEGETSAGVYRISALISYDTDNYNPPTLPSVDFVIERATVTPEALSGSVYDGEIKRPLSHSPLYTLEYEGEIRNAGVYTLCVVLTDPKNYRTDKDKLEFTVLPRELSITVGNTSVYIDGVVDAAEYYITEGSVLSLDNLMLKQVIIDGRVFLSSDNPNYKLNIISGEAITRTYPSPKTVRIILLIAFSLLLLLLLLFIAYGCRDNLRDRIAAALCKHHNRKILVIQSDFNTLSAEKEEPRSVQSDIGTVIGDTADFREAKSEGTDSPTLDTDSFTAHHIGGALEALSVDTQRADELISDSLAKDLVKRTREFVITDGTARGIINVDTLSESFSEGARVDVNILKEHGLVADNVGYLKVLARGSVDKSLSVYANDFSLSAVKMIALTGGEAIKVQTLKRSKNDRAKELGDI